MKRILIMLFLTGCLLLPFANAANQSVFNITTNSFNDQDRLPTVFTCDGKNISPGVKWTNIPEKTKALAFIVHDPDAPAGNFYHWILYNIPTTSNSLAENLIVPPDSSIMGKNSYGNVRYDGPCPPKGETHLYVFTLYALDSMLNVPKTLNADQLTDVIQNHTIDRVRLTAIYGR